MGNNERVGSGLRIVCCGVGRGKDDCFDNIIILFE